MISKSGRGGVPGELNANLRPTEGLTAGHAVAYPAKPHLRKEDKPDVDSSRLTGKGKLDSSKTLTEDTESVDTAPDPGVIRKTTDWVIRYENDQK